MCLEGHFLTLLHAKRSLLLSSLPESLSHGACCELVSPPSVWCLLLCVWLVVASPHAGSCPKMCDDPWQSMPIQEHGAPELFGELLLAGDGFWWGAYPFYVSILSLLSKDILDAASGCQLPGKRIWGVVLVCVVFLLMPQPPFQPKISLPPLWGPSPALPLSSFSEQTCRPVWGHSGDRGPAGFHEYGLHPCAPLWPLGPAHASNPPCPLRSQLSASLLTSQSSHQENGSNRGSHFLETL